ncbi:MAG TPA: Cof-type HAD-IIB family hydrolase [Pyrinomonadaceae bacterium]|nr:Cof-type HAD-IIB family hydrolase [Pyrinomonadaceae bacterium]
MNLIKLLALDLDGTLLNSRGKISEQNLQAIRAAEEKGVLVTIATGRRFRDARPVGLEAELNAPLITHNGALTKYAQTLETVNAAILNQLEAREVLRVGRKFCADAMISCDPRGKGLLLYDNVSESNVPLQKYIAWSRRLHGDEAEEAMRHVSSLEEVLHEVEIVHISFSGSCASMVELQAALESELGDAVKVLATVYSAQNFTLLDILHAEASKGYGLKNFAEFRHIKPEEIMVIGDNFNDLEMLEFAGLPVVMGNAAPELLENPKYETTLSTDESGVAAAIERFIL